MHMEAVVPYAAGAPEPDEAGPKRPVNVSLPAGLVAEARELGLNLSEIATAALRARVQEGRRQAWAAEARDAVVAYNARVDADGLWSDELRTF